MVLNPLNLKKTLNFFERWPKMANFPFLAPDFTYNQILYAIFNVFMDKYMYYISEMYRNDVENIFILACRGRVKMVRSARWDIFVTDKNGKFWNVDTGFYIFLITTDHFYWFY